MKKFLLKIFVLLFFAQCFYLFSDQMILPGLPYKNTIGPYDFSTMYTTWTDLTRSWDDNGTIVNTREIPLKIYVPDINYTGSFPLIMVSHGLGGNVETMTYMAEHLASHGYIVVAVQHHRSDTDYLEDHGFKTLLIAAGQSEKRILRLEDMHFVLDKLIGQDHSIPLLLNRIDTDKIGALGHSFGAFTTMSLLVQKLDGYFDYSDIRIKCGTAYSPQGIGTFGITSDSWDNMT